MRHSQRKRQKVNHEPLFPRYEYGPVRVSRTRPQPYRDYE